MAKLTEQEIRERLNKNTKKQLLDLWVGFLLAHQESGGDLEKYLKAMVLENKFTFN